MKIVKATWMLAALAIAGTVSVKAQKISQDSIKVLLLEKEYLKTSADINDLRIKLANERNNNESIKADIQDKMRRAELAAMDSKKLASKTDIQSSKSIKRAAAAADKASKLPGMWKS